MQKESKEQLAKMRLLMERMENHYTRSEVEMLTESTNVKRKQVSRDEILDVLDKMDEMGGRFVSFTYVKPIDFYKTKKSWRPDDMTTALNNNASSSEEDWHKKLSDFNDPNTTVKKNPISSIVVAQQYLVHWTSPSNYQKAYSKYSNGLHNLRMSMGIGLQSDGMLGDNNNQKVDTGSALKQNQTGKLSRDMNMVGSKVKTTNYVIDDNGNIVSVIPNDIVRAMSTPRKAYDIESYVAKALEDNPDKIAEYKAEKAKLDAEFKGQNFIFDKILTIVATIDNVSYYYINDKIETEIAKKSEVMVNQDDFKKIATEQLNQTFNEIDSSEFAKA